MTTTTPKRRIGRKRWGDLVKYLTATMNEPGSQRVRMQAAMRLADILTLRETREQLELRRDLRDAGKAVDAPDTPGQHEPSPEAPETVEAFLQRIRGSKLEEVRSDDE